MPVTRTLPYQWYDTPNIRVGTFADFEVLARRNGLQILDSFGLQAGRSRSPAADSCAAEAPPRGKPAGAGRRPAVGS
jgi:hypothetical protein